jgi:hypothetical protein
MLYTVATPYGPATIHVHPSTVCTPTSALKLAARLRRALGGYVK